MNLYQKLSLTAMGLILSALPVVAFASVESTLSNIQGKLIGTVLPLVAIIGIVLAGISFVTGNENAKRHIVLAMIGAAIGFGAPSIVSFIRALVN